MIGDETDPLVEKGSQVKPGVPSYGFWGATEDIWLGGNWARGRAMVKDVWRRDGSHNFCAIHSGARGFLGGTELIQEISIQLWAVNPCCPGTRDPLGDARTEPVADILARIADSPVMKALNAGNPYGMGEAIGVPEAFGRERANELQNVCLWCDEFLESHFDMATMSRREETAESSQPRFSLPVIKPSPDDLNSGV